MRFERAAVLILKYVLTSIHDTYAFEGDVIFFIISYALIVGWKINLVLLKNLVLLIEYARPIK